MKIIRLIGGLAFILGLFTVIFVGIPWYVYQDPLLPWWLAAAVYFLIGGILVVLVAVGIEHKGIKDLEKETPADKPKTRMLIQTNAEVPGRKIKESLGLVRGHTIYAVSLGKDLSALMRLIPGGELVEYTDMMGEARKLAKNRMIINAEEMGADAVINVRFVTTSVVTGAAELLAYGTAVKLAEKEVEKD